MYYTSASLSRMKGRKGSPWRGTLSYKDEWGRYRQVRKVFSGIELKRDAKIALQEWRAEMELKAELQENKTLEQAVEFHLARQLSMNQISEVTLQNSLRLARKSVFPYIGIIRFGDARREDLQRLIDFLIVSYKPTSVRTIFSIVSKTFKEAYRRGELNVDPTVGVILPRVTRREVNYLDCSGRERFFGEMTQACPFYLASMIAYYTGMRAGEICALRYKDIDFSVLTIRVERAAKEIKTENGVRIKISDTKTHKTRSIPILPQLQTILEGEYVEGFSDADSFVVSQRNPRLLCTSFLKWSRRHGVLGATGKPITMHGLRHTFATLGVQSGMDIKSLSSILGHSSAAMTLDIYASADEHAKRLAMERLGLFLEDV